MSLTEYRRKRSFERTPEPRGGAKRRRGRKYLIQKHDASHLHFDLRLEWDGVLKSWAVPKGPSLDPAEKRLAVEVEDHPLEYGSFEGTIPAGEYGAGTVMLWDRGEWSPEGDVADSLRRGALKFTLQGERLRGGWMLVRLRRDRSRGGKPNWLLVKERDAFATPKADSLDKYDTSVATGRTMPEIEAGTAAKRQSKRGRVTKSRRATKHPRQLDGARRAALPLRPQAQLATLVDAPPEGEEWLHEVKFDGYRMFARVDGDRVKWISRNGLDWTGRMVSLSGALIGLPCRRCVLDGEVVVLDQEGVSRFELLQETLSGERDSAQLIYYAFDCLHCDGYDLTRAPLTDRKAVLQRLIDGQSPRSPQLRYSAHSRGRGHDLRARACTEHWEGIVSKLASAAYLPGRSTSWLKSKCRQGQELVIGGYTNPEGARAGFGSLLMGYYDHGELVYAGRVGAGFNTESLQRLGKRLQRAEIDQRPFHEWPSGISQRGVHWVRPELVAQIEFSNWTRDKLMRQGVFMGLREDKPAAAVRFETPARKPRGVKRAPDENGHARNSTNGQPELTNPQRVLFPDVGLTKQDLADYYAAVAEWMLPHLVDRPLSLVRCPDGVGGKCFFQKHPPQGLSDRVPRIELAEKQGTDTYLYVRDLAGVRSLVQFGALEIHCWNARIDDDLHPDRLVFDLDPGDDVAWNEVVAAARGLRVILEELNLVSFLKTTGGKGLHVVVPMQRRRPWSEIKAFARGVAEAMTTAAPDHYTTNLAKRARTGKVFIDYLRNERGATSVAPYSTRARATAPVSLPIAWDALSRLEGPGQYPLLTVLRLLKRRRIDPWAEMFITKQSITAAMLKRFHVSAT